MKNIYLKLLSFFLFIAFGTVNAQEFQGIATYQFHRKLDFKDDNNEKGPNINSELRKQLEEQLKKQAHQEYTLHFNQRESIYKKSETLQAPTPSKSGISISFSDGADLRYKNIKEQRFTNQTESYGKLFLIQDSLKSPQWELLNETKNIGEYTCFKAQLKEEVESKQATETGFKTVMKEKITIAWYTPQIPVSNGPAEFHGLPGLILEINDGKTTLICSKIVINPEENFTIQEPKKGKKVSQTEYKAIMDKKFKELQDQMGTRGKGGNTVIFSSGG